MKILLMGPQGAGKGTIAALLEEKLSLPHISMGDLLREALEQSSDVADEIRSYMKQGLLVPLATIKKVIQWRLSQPDTQKGFILDGFPRDDAQREVLKEISSVDFVIVLSVPREVSIQRLSSRVQCASCGAIYNLETLPPKKEGVCDACSCELYSRDDDKPEAINKRLDIYEKETKPLLSHYADKVIMVDTSSKTPEEIVAEICSKIRKP